MSLAPYITVVPTESRETLYLAYSRGLIEFETMAEKLRKLEE